MPTLGVEFNASAMDVEFDDCSMTVILVDGREISIPLEYLPRLRDATPEQREAWVITGHGYGIHWEDLDEDVSVRGLLRIH